MDQWNSFDTVDLLVDLPGNCRFRKLRHAFLLALVVGTASWFLSGCGSETAPQLVAQLATIEGASMFPSLPGNHFQVKCSLCGFRFNVDGDNIPVNRLVVCPNCGKQDVDLGMTEKVPSRLLKVLPADEPIARWDRLAFRIPDRPGNEVGVKRVVALPGEEVAIIGGEIVVDGRIPECPLPIKRQLLEIVHDNRFLPPRSNRWVADTKLEKVGGCLGI